MGDRITFRRVIPKALTLATAAYPRGELFSVSAHGLLPTGDVRPLPDPQGALGLWYFLFRDDGKARAIVHMPGPTGEGGWKLMPEADVPMALLVGPGLDLRGVADSDTFAEYFCGHA